MFKLTEEQINYIIEFYGGSKTIIKNIERELNLIGVIDDEDEYFEVVIAIISLKESIKFQRQQGADRLLKTKDVIAYVLNDKYNNFEEQSAEKQARMKSFC